MIFIEVAHAKMKTNNGSISGHIIYFWHWLSVFPQRRRGISVVWSLFIADSFSLNRIVFVCFKKACEDRCEHNVKAVFLWDSFPSEIWSFITSLSRISPDTSLLLMKTFHQNHVYTEMVDVELICENLGRLSIYSVLVSLCMLYLVAPT